ncbi:MAG: ABC transporter ATP-binding protein [Vulcanibacillus sp.]
MNKNIIQIKGVRKSFKDVEVLKEVDLEVEQGDIFALLGSNGAGKTTMIRIMTTLLKADAGSVVINGFDIEKNPGDIRGFGMSEAADRRVGTYSGGMKRSIDIAMSLVGNPKIIFLDEPTTGLDLEARLEVWKIIKELSAVGTTVFLTTQYLEEAEQLADKIAILHGRKIIALDTLEGLKKLFPPAKVEYVEKQPTLGEIF